MKNINIEVGAVYRIKNLSSQGGFRFYRCTGNYLGATGHENLVGFEPLDRACLREIIVPREMLWAMEKLEKVSGEKSLRVVKR